MTATDLTAPNQEALDAISRSQESEFDGATFQTPILKIGQPLTREVQDGNAEVGEFINTLTGDGLGDELQFIVAYYQQGRFASDKKTKRAYTAFSDTIPNSWADLVGEEFVGTPFSQYPDAEETFKERVNAKEIEWGSGPLVSTTHNYTGLALVSAEEDSDEDVELQPVRLSLQRTNMPAVRKFNTIKKALLRNRPFWDIVFDLGVYSKEFTQGKAYLLNVKAEKGSNTTPEQKAEAVELATAVLAGQVQSNDDALPEGDRPAAEPDAKGGADI